LLPDPFYRYGPYGPLVPKDVFEGDMKAILGPLVATTGNDEAAQDTEVYIASADNDGSYAPAMAAQLEDALTKAGVH
jgi:carboxymethylenebutenolidase